MGRWDFFDWTGLDHGRPITHARMHFDWYAFVQSERCKPISDSIQKKKVYGVPKFERQAVDMNMKGVHQSYVPNTIQHDH